MASTDLWGSGIYGAGVFGVGAVDDTTPPVVTPPDPTQPANPTQPSPDPVIPADPAWVPADPGLSLVGTNGDVILIRLSDDEYGALQGVSGIGIPPRSLSIFEGAADGGTVRYTRTGIRELDVPVGIFGATRGEVAERQRRLASALRARKGAPAARFRFTLETGEVYEIVVHYVSGAETTIGTDGRASFCRWVLTFQAPDPYWTSVKESSFTISSGGTHRGLLPSLTRLQLSPSQVLGQVSIDNPGDVESDLEWTITGPGGPFVARCSTGESFTILDHLDPGEQRIVDTAKATVVDQAGNNQYAGLGPAPKLFKLPDGKSTVLVTLDGSTSDSSVVGRFRARREVVY